MPLRHVSRNLRLIDNRLRNDPEANRLFLEILANRKDGDMMPCSGAGSIARIGTAGGLPAFVVENGADQDETITVTPWRDHAWQQACTVSVHYDAVFSANTLHIMSWEEVEQLFAHIAQVTTDNATLAIYGPFNYNGEYSSQSNAAFDDWLQARGAHMRIRDAEAVDALAEVAGFDLIDDVAMPANNRLRIWQRTR